MLKGKKKQRRFPDEFQHELFMSWHKHRQQALFRGEDYELEPEQWIELWTPEMWARRGRSRESVCLIRINCTKPWSKENCAIVPRVDQLRRTNANRKQQGPYMSINRRTKWI